MTPYLPTAAGLRLACHPVLYVIPSDPAEALAWAATVERLADFHLAEGRTSQADRLSHLALEARCRATGARA